MNNAHAQAEAVRSAAANGMAYSGSPDGSGYTTYGGTTPHTSTYDQSILNQGSQNTVAAAKDVFATAQAAYRVAEVNGDTAAMAAAQRAMDAAHTQAEAARAATGNYSGGSDGYSPRWLRRLRQHRRYEFYNKLRNFCGYRPGRYNQSQWNENNCGR